MARLLIFGPGYCASWLMRRMLARGWDVTSIARTPGEGQINFVDEGAVVAAIADATHILSSVPPDVDGGDPVLVRYGQALAVAPARWLGYLSSTGVYGDCGGAWVDESAPVKGRRAGRNLADCDWRLLRGDVRVFRLPGIYGPGRSAIDRLREGKAHRIDMPGQVFSRIHVDDVTGAIIASFSSAEAGAFNIADDEPASQNSVVACAASLIGVSLPPMLAMDDPAISAASRAFYAENRRVANGRAKRLLGWTPRFPDYRAGLAACL
mgnify:CR=1 FL=1